MKLKRKITPFIVILFWIGIWYLLSFLINNTLLFPSPNQVLKTLFIMLKEKYFYKVIFTSFINISIGIISSFIIAILLVYISNKSYFLNKLIDPLMSIIKATPVASLIILLLVFIGNNKVPSIITFLIVLPIIWSNLNNGIKNIDKSLKEVTIVFKFNKSKTFKALIYPSLKPYLLSSLESSIGIGWKAGIAAEIIARSKNSIGYAISDSKQYIETSKVFAWTIVVIIISMIIEKLFKYIFNNLKKENNYVKD